MLSQLGRLCKVGTSGAKTTSLLKLSMVMLFSKSTVEAVLFGINLMFLYLGLHKEHRPATSRAVVASQSKSSRLNLQLFSAPLPNLRSQPQVFSSQQTIKNQKSLHLSVLAPLLSPLYLEQTRRPLPFSQENAYTNKPTPLNL